MGPNLLYLLKTLLPCTVEDSYPMNLLVAFGDEFDLPFISIYGNVGDGDGWCIHEFSTSIP